MLESFEAMDSHDLGQLPVLGPLGILSCGSLSVLIHSASGTMRTMMLWPEFGVQQLASLIQQAFS